VGQGFSCVPAVKLLWRIAPSWYQHVSLAPLAARSCSTASSTLVSVKFRYLDLINLHVQQFSLVQQFSVVWLFSCAWPCFWELMSDWYYSTYVCYAVMCGWKSNSVSGLGPGLGHKELGLRLKPSGLRLRLGTIGLWEDKLISLSHITSYSETVMFKKWTLDV